MELLIGNTPREQAVNILGRKLAGYRIGVGDLPPEVKKEYARASFKYWNVYKQSRRRIPGLEERYKFHRLQRNPYYSRMPKAQLSKTTPTIITSETKSYQGMGFSKPQSQYLAKQGAKQGISFTSRGARQLIQQQRRLPIEIKRLPKRKAVSPICILKPTEMRKLKFTPISRLSPTERITLKGPVDRLIEKSNRLISEIKRKGPTSKLMREKKSLLNELSKKEVRLGATKETHDLIGKRKELIRTEKPSPTREAKLITLTVASSLIGFGLGMKQLVTHPVSSIKSLPSSLKEEVEEVGFLIRVSPTEAIAKIGTEILLLKGTGKALTVTGKVGGKLRARLSPKFKGVKGNIITVPSQVRGKTIKIKIGGPVKKLAEPLRRQVRLAGKEVIGVSAQADRLLRLIKKTKVVRKPIPGERKLSFETWHLLRKFDKKKITKNELIRLDKNIKKELKMEGSSLLERSFFADPRGRLRPSRLGIVEKEASLSDIIRGDVTFKTLKPQVLIFEKVLVEKFPKALKGIERKLKAGKSLTRNEANRLLQFQLKKSAKFKPIGHLTREPEISLAPGEIIKKGKTIAVTIIQGKRVPIVRATIVKAKPGTKTLLNKAKAGKITTSELKRLRSNLRKETGFRTSLSRGRIGKPRVRIPKSIPRTLPERRLPKRRPVPRRRIPRRRPPRRKPIPRRIPRRPRRPPKRPPRRPPVRPPRRPVRRPPRRPPIRPPGKPPIKPPIRPFPRRGIRRRKKVMRPQSWEVWARPLKPTKKGRKPKLIKVSKVPLSKKRARDLRNYITDTSLSRTALMRPSRGKPGTPRLRTPKGYSRRTSAKFRGYRIQKGKRIPLKKGRVIEKRRHLLDTIQEKKQITLRRRIAQLSKPRRLPKRRPSPKRKTIKRRKSSRRGGGIFDF